MKNIKYIGHFETQMHRRSASPAGVTMMDYVSNAIQRTGYSCTILSTAPGFDTSMEKCETLDDGRRIIFQPTHRMPSKRNLFVRLYRKMRRSEELYNYLNKHIQEGDTIVVYHSPIYINALQRLRTTKKFRLILQVCEIYADVTGKKRQKAKELNWIDQADGYIFSTSQLEKSINIKKKHAAICLGTYTINPQKNAEKYNDGKIHLVYAGTFDIRKGAIAAINSSKYLPENYHMHILGFGSKKEVCEIKNAINKIQAKSVATISYEGLLKGQKYTEFLQRCHIGLSTQQPNAAFNATSFPSKILSYMSNGLQVVTIRIPVIEHSHIGKNLYYYERQEPAEIARAIMSVNVANGIDNREILKELDQQLKSELSRILF